ncbi:MAG TPA: L,D-transpeptidase family protein [Thermoanaerobaculia bacterium]|nr:L,D-transpeptidase family protein [Thermoanaerobaculia bacterium]
MNQHPEDEDAKTTSQRRPEGETPLLASFTDLRLIVVLLAVLALLSVGVTSVAGRTSGPQEAERTPHTGSLGQVGELDLPETSSAAPLAGLQAATSRWVDALEAGEPVTPDLVPARAAEKQHERVVRFYRQRDARPAWLTADGSPKPAMDELIVKLEGDADSRPLGERAEQVARRLGDGEATTDERARLDGALTYIFFTHASELMQGRVGPDEIADKIWRTEPRDLDLVAVLEEALADGHVGDALDRLEPPHDGYARLLGAYHTYQQLAAMGGWPTVPDGPAIDVDEEMAPERYRALVERLHAEGYLSRAAAESRLTRLDRNERTAAESAAAETTGGGTTGGSEAAPEPVLTRLDHGLSTVLRHFQESHGLEVDGILGPNAQAALNVSAEERVRQIALNLERWRWLPADLGESHLRVNIPAFELQGVRDGRVTLEMPVVLGQRSWPTPVMTESLERVVVNPYWNVPKSIVAAEIGPKLAKDPDYLRRQGFEVLENGQRAQLASIEPDDLDDPGVRVRQTPGAYNALGQIKFLFPNQYSVYMHDTPHQSAFERHDRARSHGCVRVARPLDLAAWVFEGSADMESVEERIGSRSPATLELEEELPVHLLYFTAFVDETGRMQFRDDVYGYDAAHRQALLDDGWTPSSVTPLPAVPSPVVAAD